MKCKLFLLLYYGFNSWLQVLRFRSDFDTEVLKFIEVFKFIDDLKFTEVLIFLRVTGLSVFGSNTVINCLVT